MKYDAFISYRHLERDMYVAKGIHKALETTKIPLRIRKEIGKSGIQRVFRDQEELPIGSSLSENIEAALAESEFLVVICSPQTKESTWVMKEIDTFISMHGKQNILAVLVDGEPEDSFPEQLMTDDFGNPREPLAADVRGNSKSEIRKKIKSESLRLAASILYCDYDTLRQRHRERVMRRYTAIAAGVAALGVAFGVYNAYNLARINENYRQKLTNESKVLASTSRQVLETGNRKAAALIALEALPGEGNDRPFVPDAMYALSEALGTYSTGYDQKKDKLLIHDVLVSDFVVDKEKTRVFSHDSNEALYYWDVQTGDLLFKVNTVYFEGQKDRVQGVGINETCASAITQHYFTGYDEAGNRVYDIHFEDDNVTSACYSKSANYVAASFRDYLIIFDARTGKEVKRLEEDGIWFYSDMIFKDDEKVFAVETRQVDDSGWGTVKAETSTLSVYDMETWKKVDLTVDMNSILGMNFTPDDYLAVVSTEEDSLITNGEFTDSVQKMDYRTGETIWKSGLNRFQDLLSGGNTVVKGRVYNSPQGRIGELFVSSNRNLYNFDLYTGEVNCVSTVEDDIVTYYINLENEIVRVGLYNGEIVVLDGYTGYNYADYTQSVGESLNGYYSGNGYVLASMRLSPDIVIMSCLEDPTKETVVTCDYNIYGMEKSPEGDTYLYTNKESLGGAAEIHVMDAATDKEIVRFSLKDVVSSDIHYRDKNTILAHSTTAGFYFCDIETGDVELMEGTEDELAYWVISGDNKIALASDGKKYKRFDLDSRKLLDEGAYTEEFGMGQYYKGAFSPKGDLVYYWDLDGRLYRYDFEDKELEQIFESYTILNAEFTKDFSKGVIQCGDGFARVVDLSSMEVQDEVSYFGTTSSHLGFSDDGNKLYLHGADYYFKIYDLVKDQYVFVSDEQWNWASYTREIPDKNLFVFTNYMQMTLIDLDTYGVLGRAEYGALYFEETGHILSTKGKEIYRFKVKTLEDLISEAKEKYGDAKLTSEERLKYKLY